jgi:hypothetical protein
VNSRSAISASIVALSITLAACSSTTATSSVVSTAISTSSAPPAPTQYKSVAELVTALKAAQPSTVTFHVDRTAAAGTATIRKEEGDFSIAGTDISGTSKGTTDVASLLTGVSNPSVLEVLLVKSEVFLKLAPAQAKSLGITKTWTTSEKALGQLEVSASDYADTPVSTMSDTASALTLTSAKPEVVNGIATVHYTFTVDKAKTKTLSKKGQSDVDNMDTTELWVNAKDQVVQQDSTGVFQLATPTQFKTHEVYSEYGKTVTVTAPAAADVQK